MKKISMFVAGLVLATAAAFGQVTGSAYADAGNRYLDPGFGDVLCDDPVIQAGIDVEHSSGLYGGVWLSHSPNGQEKDTGEEGNFIAGLMGVIPERYNPPEGATYDINLTYYDEPTRLVFGKGDIWALSASTSVPVGEWTYSWKLTHYQPLPNSGFPIAWLVGPGIERSFDLGSDFSITTETELNYGHGYGFDSGFVLNPNLSLDYAFSEDVTWSLKMIGYVQLGTDDERENELAVSAGVEKSF